MSIEENIKRLVKNFTCGFCFASSGYEVVFADYSTWRGTYGDLWAGRAFAILKCNHCEMFNLLNFRVEEEDYEFEKSEEELGPYLFKNPKIVDSGWYPVSKDSFFGTMGMMSPMWLAPIGQYPYGYKLNDDIPPEIRRDLQEAGNCLAVNAINASAVMCRRVVERLASNFGVKPQRTLHRTLEKLKELEKIDEMLFEALHEVKYWGNLGAHIDSLELDSVEQARELIDLVTQVVEYAYSQDRLKGFTKKLLKRRNT